MLRPLPRLSESSPNRKGHAARVSRYQECGEGQQIRADWLEALDNIWHLTRKGKAEEMREARVIGRILRRWECISMVIVISGAEIRDKSKSLGHEYE